MNPADSADSADYVRRKRCPGSAARPLEDDGTVGICPACHRSLKLTKGRTMPAHSDRSDNG